MASKSLKRTLKAIFLSIVIYVFASAALTKVIYDTAFRRYDPPSASVSASASVRERRSVRFPSGENTLQGYLYDGERDTLVVISIGHNATSDDYLPQIDSLLDYGWGVFIFDGTGVGESEGSSCLGFPQAVADLDAALSFLEENGRFGYEQTVLLGHSQGGYAVCCVLELGHEIAAAVSVSGVNSAMEGVLAPSVGAVGALAYADYPFLWLYQASLFGADAVNTDAAEIVAGSDVPVFLAHGQGDTEIPAERFSVVSHRAELSRVECRIYAEAGQDGHTSILFDADGSANAQLMADINDFFVRTATSNQSITE